MSDHESRTSPPSSCGSVKDEDAVPSIIDSARSFDEGS